MSSRAMTLTNARLVLPHEMVTGHLAMRAGMIEAVQEGSAQGEDMEGDILLPGLVELHTDHLEVHISPRPQVRWNIIAAVQAFDAQIAASGITTVFDALRVGIDGDTGTSSEESREIAAAVTGAQDEGRLRAEHRFHLRCEVSDEFAVPGYRLFDDVPVHLVSLMDHTPGQRQFRSIDAYRTYFLKKGMTEADFERFCQDRMARSAIWSQRNRRDLAQLARARGTVLASHDDATAEHVAEAVRDGVTLAEFPTTTEAADASRAAGMRILMGGPNLVRGGSHSGNVSAGELADRNALDIISSDYVPFSMLQAAFQLSTRPGWSLPRAAATVTSTPAEVVGLADRGALLAGRRADLVRVHWPHPDAVPVVRGVWREGRRVA